MKISVLLGRFAQKCHKVTECAEWLCPTVQKSCNVSECIQKWNTVYCWQASYIIFHVFSHRYITDHKWAVHAWRQHTGICGSILLQILRWDLKCARLLPPWYNIIYLWCSSWQIRRHIISVWNYSVAKEDNMSHWTISINKTWARVYDLEMKRQSFD